MIQNIIWFNTSVFTNIQVITCAGFYSDRVAALTGGKKSLARVVTFRGAYLQFKPEFKRAVKMNIYPVPSNGGIPVGIHFTPTVIIIDNNRKQNIKMQQN